MPSTANPYYSTSSGYSYPTYSRRSRTFGLNLSKPGRNLILLILSGLVIGAITSLIYIDGIPLVVFLVQVNALVFQRWGIPSLVTSMIVVLSPIPTTLTQGTWEGLVDVVFNAISVFFVDSLLRNTYTSKQYYLVFFITGLAGNLLSLVGEPLDTLSMGASGGIFGLVAGAVTADYAIRKRVNYTLVGWFIFVFIYSSLSPNVDIFAHFGGAAVGLVAGYVIGRSRRQRSSYY